MHLVLSSRQKRAGKKLVARGPQLVIGFKPGSEANGDDGCRIEKHVFDTQMQFIDVVDRPVVEHEAVDNIPVFDAIPLKRHSEAAVDAFIREPEPVEAR